jgi:hypothetical protein
MENPAITQEDLDAVDPDWLADMLALAAQGKKPESENHADSTLIQPSRKMWKHLH